MFGEWFSSEWLSSEWLILQAKSMSKKIWADIDG